MATTAAATPAIPTEFKPLPTTREERGRQIARLGGIRQLGARYVVPSQSANSNVPTYLVDVIEQSCTCPDYETRRLRCKHQEAVLFWLAWEGAVNVETGEVTLPRKQQSRQNWPAYNRAQTTERLRVPQFLHALCLGVPDAEREVGAPGRKPIPDREAIFGLVSKVYSGCSGRRAEADLAAYVERGFLSRVWDANTLFRAMESPAMTPILTSMIEEAAGPAAQVESAAGQFAMDATGFKTSVRRVRDEKEVVVERWYDQAHKGEERRPRRFIHDWVKLHAATGTLTNIVTAARVTAGTGTGAGDSPHFIPLLHTTTKRFQVKEVSGDKGYLDEDNLTAVAAIGAQPFMRFKSNSREMDHPNEHWRRMWAYFDLKKEEFLRHYHRRSNVESTFGAIKAKFGGSVRSRKLVSQQNEVLAKVLLWNLTCIVQAIEEFGVEAEFSRLVLEKP
jgi:hypothetical protein